MMSVIIGILAVMALGVIGAFVAAHFAPIGYEDNEGFHYGPEAEQKPQDFPGAVGVLSR